MELVQKSLKTKVWFWAFLGPFLTVLTFFISLLKVAPGTFYLPMAALIGIALSCFGRVKGLFGSLAILGAALLLVLQGVPIEERFWHLGVGMAIALTFVVAHLSFEEVGSYLSRLQMESGSRLQNLLYLDEKLKEADGAWRMQKAALERRVEQMVYELEKTRQESSAGIQSEDVGRLQMRYEEALTTQKAALSALEEELRMTLANQAQLQNELEQERSAGALVREQLKEAEGQIYVKMMDTDEAADEGRLERSKIQQQVLQLQQQLDIAAADKNHIKSLYEQLRDQFNEKGTVLHQARAELFQTQEQLLALKKDQEERQLLPSESEQKLLSEMTHLENEVRAKDKEIEAMQALVDSLMQEVAKAQLP